MLVGQPSTHPAEESQRSSRQRPAPCSARCSPGSSHVLGFRPPQAKEPASAIISGGTTASNLGCSPGHKQADRHLLKLLFFKILITQRNSKKKTYSKGAPVSRLYSPFTANFSIYWALLGDAGVSRRGGGSQKARGGHALCLRLHPCEEEKKIKQWISKMISVVYFKSDFEEGIKNTCKIKVTLQSNNLSAAQHCHCQLYTHTYTHRD